MGLCAPVSGELGKFLHVLVPSVSGIAVPQAAAAGELLQARMEHPCTESFFESLVEVAHLPEFGLDPAGIDSVLELTERGDRRIVLAESFEGGFRGQHSALDREMDSLQALRIEEAGRVAKDHPAVAGYRWNRPPSTIGQRLGAVADHLSAGEQAGDERMLLEVLQHMLRVEARVRIVKPRNES